MRGILHIIMLLFTKLAFFSFLVLTPIVAGASFTEGKLESPNGTYFITWKCENEFRASCKILMHNKVGDKIVIKKKGKLPISMQWLTDSLLRFVFSCGSPCNSWVFYTFVDKKSPPYGNPQAIEVDKYLVAEPSWFESKNGDTFAVLEIYEIFSRKLVKRIFLDNFSEVAAVSLGIEEAKFVDGDKVYIRYL
ncbi:MAG: hypothetical protein OEZ58_09790, partial [Gammaproteobacteria bacterium]|nr:hypothetical protein [Gammaproteobacteria bacterium]